MSVFCACVHVHVFFNVQFNFLERENCTYVLQDMPIVLVVSSIDTLLSTYLVYDWEQGYRL